MNIIKKLDAILADAKLSTIKNLTKIQKGKPIDVKYIGSIDIPDNQYLRYTPVPEPIDEAEIPSELRDVLIHFDFDKVPVSPYALRKIEAASRTVDKEIKEIFRKENEIIKRFFAYIKEQTLTLLSGYLHKKVKINYGPFFESSLMAAINQAFLIGGTTDQLAKRIRLAIYDTNIKGLTDEIIQKEVIDPLFASRGFTDLGNEYAAVVKEYTKLMQMSKEINTTRQDYSKYVIKHRIVSTQPSKAYDNWFADESDNANNQRMIPEVLNYDAEMGNGQVAYHYVVISRAALDIAKMYSDKSDSYEKLGRDALSGVMVAIECVVDDSSKINYHKPRIIHPVASALLMPKLSKDDKFRKETERNEHLLNPEKDNWILAVEEIDMMDDKIHPMIIPHVLASYVKDKWNIEHGFDHKTKYQYPVSLL